MKKVDFKDWEDVQPAPLQEIKEFLENVRVSAILMDRQLVAEGFTFIVEYRNVKYFLMNSNDYARATGKPESHLFGIPVFEDREFLKKIMCGVFYGGAQYRSLTRN